MKELGLRNVERRVQWNEAAGMLKRYAGRVAKMSFARFGVVMKAGLSVFPEVRQRNGSARIIVCLKAVACPRTVYTWPCQGMVFWHSSAHVLGEVLDRLYDLTIGRV